MSQTDPIADFITCIRNAQSARKPWVDIPSSNLKKRICYVLKEEHSDKATNLKICNDPRIIKTSHIGGTAIQAQEVAYKHVISKLDEKIR